MTGNEQVSEDFRIYWCLSYTFRYKWEVFKNSQFSEITLLISPQQQNNAMFSIFSIETQNAGIVQWFQAMKS